MFLLVAERMRSHCCAVFHCMAATRSFSIPPMVGTEVVPVWALFEHCHYELPCIQQAIKLSSKRNLTLTSVRVFLGFIPKSGIVAL